jgi:hypothetical protein
MLDGLSYANDKGESLKLWVLSEKLVRGKLVSSEKMTRGSECRPGSPCSSKSRTCCFPVTPVAVLIQPGDNLS